MKEKIMIKSLKVDRSVAEGDIKDLKVQTVRQYLDSVHLLKNLMSNKSN